MFIEKNVGIFINDFFQIILLPNKFVIEKVPLLDNRVFAVAVVVTSIKRATVDNNPIKVVDELLIWTGLDVVFVNKLCDIKVLYWVLYFGANFLFLLESFQHDNEMRPHAVNFFLLFAITHLFAPRASPPFFL